MAVPSENPGPDDDLQPEYDFRSLRGVVDGKYTERSRERLRMVRLAADVSAALDRVRIVRFERVSATHHPDLGASHRRTPLS